VKVLDTDTCIEILRSNDAVIARRAATDDAVVTTWVSAAELTYGAAKSRAPEDNTTVVTDFLATLPVLGLDHPAVLHFGPIKARLERAGQMLADADLFIASIALANGASVVTGNRRHYERIEGLRLEDWIRS
jgi:tRNA(fMet)-specific endonuclease VapC